MYDRIDEAEHRLDRSLRTCVVLLCLVLATGFCHERAQTDGFAGSGAQFHLVKTVRARKTGGGDELFEGLDSKTVHIKLLRLCRG